MAWLLSFLFSVNSFASTVLIQGPQTHTSDYNAMLKSHSDYISPTEEYLRRHPLSANREQLLNLFSEAQRAFLEKTAEETKQKFQQVISLLPNDDWGKSDRDIFLHAYLRLAQVESDNGERDRWLAQSLFLDDAEYDSNLFPPPLINRRQELARQVPRKILPDTLMASGWTEILINGRRCGKKDCGNWPMTSGKVRVTVLADQWASQTAVLDISEFNDLKPPTLPFATGNCATTNFQTNAEIFAIKKVFWSLNCGRPESVANINLKPQAPIENPIAAIHTTEKPKPIYESKWFWAGVGTIAAILIVSNSQKHEVKDPSTSYGY